MADETQVTTEEQRNSPAIAFITHGNLKHDPPLHAFITYAKGVEPDGGGEISTQLLNFSASAKKENNKTTIAISWNLNGLHHAVIHIKKVQAEADNEVDWTGVEVADTLTMDQGVTSTEYEGAQEGYKYQIEGVGVDVFGDTSKATNTPKAEVFIAKAVDPNPNPNPNPNPEPDPSPEQPTEKLFEFHYVPDEGVLPGLIFEQQTEDVINDIGNYAYFAQKTASKALKTGLEASEAARTALNAAQNAQSTADYATELANTGISKADAAQGTADDALAGVNKNANEILATNAEISNIQQTLDTHQTQINKNANDIKVLNGFITGVNGDISSNAQDINDLRERINDCQQYERSSESVNELTAYGRYYVTETNNGMPSDVKYPVVVDVIPVYNQGNEYDLVLQRVVDANGISYYRFATEKSEGADTTYTFGDWKSIDTRYLKLTGGTVTGETIFSGKLTASGETTFSGKFTASGETSVPTPSTENNSKTIANTEFVHGVVSNLVNGAPDALNTLQELATALGNDPNFSTTILNKIGEKESKTDAQIEHEKLQNEIDLSLKGKDVLRGGTPDNPGTVNIPLEAGMFPIYGFPDGSFKEQPTYPYAVVINFQGTSGAFLSLYSLNYFFNETEGLYYRIGFQGKGWNTTWHKVANTANVKKQISDALTNYARLTESFLLTEHGKKVVETNTLTDLNSIECLSYPSWYCRFNKSVSSIANCPTNFAFHLFNLSNSKQADGTLPNLATNYYNVIQILIDVSGNVWRRTAANKKTTTFSFSAWVKVALTSDLPTKTSQLTNDSGFATTETVDAEIQKKVNDFFVTTDQWEDATADNLGNGYLMFMDTMNEIPKKVPLNLIYTHFGISRLVTKEEYAKLVLSNGHLSINGSELWIE